MTTNADIYVKPYFPTNNPVRNNIHHDRSYDDDRDVYRTGRSEDKKATSSRKDHQPTHRVDDKRVDDKGQYRDENHSPDEVKSFKSHLADETASSDTHNTAKQQDKAEASASHNPNTDHGTQDSPAKSTTTQSHENGSGEQSARAQTSEDGSYSSGAARDNVQDHSGAIQNNTAQNNTAQNNTAQNNNVVNAAQPPATETGSNSQAQKSNAPSSQHQAAATDPAQSANQMQGNISGQQSQNTPSAPTETETETETEKAAKTGSRQNSPSASNHPATPEALKTAAQNGNGQQSTGQIYVEQDPTATPAAQTSQASADKTGPANPVPVNAENTPAQDGTHKNAQGTNSAVGTTQSGSAENSSAISPEMKEAYANHSLTQNAKTYGEGTAQATAPAQNNIRADQNKVPENNIQPQQISQQSSDKAVQQAAIAKTAAEILQNMPHTNGVIKQSVAQIIKASGSASGPQAITLAATTQKAHKGAINASVLTQMKNSQGQNSPAHQKSGSPSSVAAATGQKDGGLGSLLQNMNNIQNALNNTQTASLLPESNNQMPLNTAGQSPNSLPQTGILPTQQTSVQTTTGTGNGFSQDSVKSSPQMVTKQISMAIAKNTANGNDGFTIKLSPDDLGQVEIKMNFQTDGKIQAVLMVENDKTLTLMQKDQATLEKALQNAGFETNGDSLNFSLKQQGQDAQKNQLTDNGQEGTQDQDRPFDAENPLNDPQQIRMRYSSNALDINV